MTLTARAVKTNSLTAAATSALATDLGGSSATLPLVQGSQAALAVIGGTFTATLQFEAQGAGGTWFAAPALPIGTSGGALVTSATAAGNFLVLAAGAVQVRVRCSAFTSGPAAVELSNAPVGGIGYNVASPSGITDVQGLNGDGGALSNPMLEGLYESSTVVRDARAMNAPFADLSTGKGVAAVNIPGLATTGSLAAPGQVTLNPIGAAQSVSVDLTGTYTGLTFTFQALMGDGTTWRNINGYTWQSSTGTVVGLTTSALNGTWTVPCGGFLGVRINVTAIATGTATFALAASIAPQLPAIDSQGNVRSAIWVGNSGSAVSGITAAGSADTTQNNLTALAVVPYNLAYDDVAAQWNRLRNNTLVSLLASTGRTGTTVTATQTNFNARGLVLALNVTVNPGGAQTLTLSLQAVINGVSYNINLGVANAFAGGAGSSILVFYPGAATAWTGGTEHLTFQAPVPRAWTATVTHSAAGSWTYTLDAAYIV